MGPKRKRRLKEIEISGLFNRNMELSIKEVAKTVRRAVCWGPGGYRVLLYSSYTNYRIERKLKNPTSSFYR